MKYGWNIENELTFGELSRDFYYANLLVDNVMAENLTEVRTLLESKKANPNTVVPELGVAPLHLLAGLENEDFSSTVTLQAILRSGGDPNVRSEDGLTPVHVAAMWGRCQVLEILLANGGDPDLIDYKMFLNAEEYAIREEQWKSYGVLSAFSVMTDGEKKLDRYLEEKSCGSEISSEFSNFSNKGITNQHVTKLKDKATNYSEDISSNKSNENRFLYSTIVKNKKLDKKNKTDEESRRGQSERSKSTIKSLKLNEGALSTIKRQRRKTNIYESTGTISDNVYLGNRCTGNSPKEKRNKLSLYGDAVSESCDWIRKSVNSIKLDKSALDTIRTQRISSKIYQTKGLGEDPLAEREKKPPLYEESETCDWVDPRSSETFDESSLNKIRVHRTRTTTYKSEDPEDRSMLSSGPKLPKRNRKRILKKKEDSEMYLCGYAEESIRPNEPIRQRRSRYLSSGLSDVNSSDFDEPNQRMLCKMSRIFLFMLKKRHIYQKIK